VPLVGVLSPLITVTFFAETIMNNVNRSLIMPNLEMLTAREQLMEDIDSICDEFFCEHFPNSQEQFDDLVRVLCDAVVRNFPTN
jgi:hypothetical protein